MRTPVNQRSHSHSASLRPERHRSKDDDIKQLKKMHALEKRLTCLERDSQRMQKREMRQKLRAISRKRRSS